MFTHGDSHQWRLSLLITNEFEQTISNSYATVKSRDRKQICLLSDIKPGEQSLDLYIDDIKDDPEFEIEIIED